MKFNSELHHYPTRHTIMGILIISHPSKIKYINLRYGLYIIDLDDLVRYGHWCINLHPCLLFYLVREKLYIFLSWPTIRVSSSNLYILLWGGQRLTFQHDVNLMDQVVKLGVSFLARTIICCRTLLPFFFAVCLVKVFSRVLFSLRVAAFWFNLEPSLPDQVCFGIIIISPRSGCFADILHLKAVHATVLSQPTILAFSILMRWMYSW